ncbi:MAG: hypothetical protein ACQEUZ_06280 [Pseudomonadota bacterium]
MTRQLEILTRYRDDWNAKADRLDAEAEAWAHHDRIGPFAREMALTYRLMAWKAQTEISLMTENREAA